MTNPIGTAEARAAILALLAEFTSRVDGGESVADLFQDQAVYSTPRGDTRGGAAIAQLFASMFESRKKAGHVSRHSCQEVRVIAAGTDRFEVRSLMMAFALDHSASAPGSLLIGDQSDIVSRDADGVYRFAQRKLVPALEFSLSPKTEVRP